jgi:hypothetical protein
MKLKLNIKQVFFLSLLWSAILICPNSLCAQDGGVLKDDHAIVEEPAPIVVEEATEYVENLDEKINETAKVEERKKEKQIIEKAQKENGTPAAKTIDQKSWKEIVSKKDFQYKKPDPPKAKKPEPEPKVRRRDLPDLDLDLSKRTRVALLYGAVALALCFILYAFFGGKYIARGDKLVNEDQHADFEDVEHFTEWELALRTAEQEDDYRKCVRILYNQTLQKLINNNLIAYKKEATNSNYLGALYNTPYYQDFANQTRIFNYVWYGDYTIGNEQYQVAKQGFNALINKLS